MYQRLLWKQRIRTAVFIMTIIVPLSAFANPSIPLTEQAMDKLTVATKKVEQPLPKPGSTPSEDFSAYVEYYKKVYNTAGYDLEKSIIQVNKDVAIDTEYLRKISLSPSASAYLFTVGLINDFNKISESSKLPLTKYFSSQAAKAITGFKDTVEKYNTKIKSAEISTAKANVIEIEREKEEHENGIFRGKIFIIDNNYCLSYSDFDCLYRIIGASYNLNVCEQPGEQKMLKQLNVLVGEKVVVKCALEEGSTQFNIDSGIEIVPDNVAKETIKYKPTPCEPFTYKN